MKKEKALHVLVLMLICTLPFMTLLGCGSDSCIRCTMCGDDDTRMLVYATGTDQNGVEYISCIGPAAIFGFGVDSKCWPTECVYVRQNSGEAQLTGCVKYYNETGCISNTNVKSNGDYKDSLTCLGIACFGSSYNEVVAESTKASERASCLGLSCGSPKSVQSRDLNKTMPRMFVNGCWTN